jgi:replication factor C small subunit
MNPKTKKKLDTNIWTELFRPSTAGKVLLPERLQNQLYKLNDNLYQNLLLAGPPGIGKTTIAKILASNYKYAFWNISDQSSVEVLRSEVTDFCKSYAKTIDDKGNSSNIKVVIFDEIDGASKQFLDALRPFVEQYQNVRFIATCNYINKITDPIRDRFELMDLVNISNDEEKELKNLMAKKAKGIMDATGIGYDNKETIYHLVDKNYPSFRSVVKRLQTLYNNNEELNSKNLSSINYQLKDVYELILSGKGDPQKNFTVLSAYKNSVDEVLEGLGTNFIEYIREYHQDKLTYLPIITIKVAEYQAKRLQVIDTFVNLLACVFDIQTSIHQ